MTNMIKYNTKKDSYKFKKESVNFFINIGLEVTRRCNLKCIHCCESVPVPDNSLENIKAMVDKLSSEGLKKICITGGEPLLRKDLIDILRYIHDKEIYITLSTNGLILDKDKLLSIKPYIDNIRFSLHGKEKTHDKITRHKGSFRKVIDGIKIATNLRIPVSIVSSIIYQNYPEMLDIARVCENNGVGKLHFFSLISRGRGKFLYNKEYVSPENMKKKLNKILNIAEKESWNLGLNIVDWAIEGRCALLFPDGTLVAIQSFKNKDNIRIVGNLLESSPRLLWNKYPFKENYINHYKIH